MSDVVGWEAHAQAVTRLRASYDAIPAGETVRLAKHTSNLFRPRSTAQVPGLDVSGLKGVISVDALDGGGASADVQGMCTYEDLVAVTLARGFIPFVVPQLRSITLGGAVSGMGIESTSFRNGLPHESVVEMDVLTGDGAVVTTRPGDRLFDAFPNSYGSLGYATRIRIRLEQVPPFVDLAHLRFDDLDTLAKTVEPIIEDGAYDGVRVDGLDGVAFSPDEAYVTLATWSPRAALAGTSDYTGQELYFRSIQQRETDTLTMDAYLWRWDTDWFWCSGAFGLHDPRVRRLWPRRWRRSDVYHRLVGLDARFGVVERLDRRRGKPPRERVIQDIEVPVGRMAEFVRWFDEAVGMRPVWLCPLRATRPWPSYPLNQGETYINVGFWGTVPLARGVDGDTQPGRRGEVHDWGGTSRSTRTHTTTARPSTASTRTPTSPGQAETRPRDRLTRLYEKAVTSMTSTEAQQA